MDLGTARWQRGHGWQQPLPGIDARPTLVLAFGPSELLEDPEPVNELLAAYPGAAVVGCSTAGEILADTVSDGTLTVAVAQFDSTRLNQVEECLENPADSYYAGLRLAEKLVAAEPEMNAVFVLSEGLGVNGSAVAAGLVQGTAGRVVISGGLAGDGDRFGRTWVLGRNGLNGGHVVAVGLAGPDLQVRHGSGGGWDPFGPVRRITRSEGNVLYELDGQPALELYRRYLGERADGLPATALLFPLAIRAPGAPDRELVRTVLSVDG
ncbi:MAG TPA: FIST N-terminal domain-containing protein, partial [Kineosporiaceae bacterium]|nr:FIST N-terminal domain-containing protein [Kineosporiaceae bacterium]